MSQSWPLATTAMTIKCGQAVKADIVLRNDGTHAWDTNTKLGTTEPRDRSSRFAGSDWLSPSRLAHATGAVAPNGTFKFSFTFQGPTGAACVPGQYKEYFGVVEEGVTWFSDGGQGGPADNVIEALINLEAAPPPPPPGDMAHAPGDMAGQPGSDEDMAGADDDGGVVYGPDGGTDDMDPGTGGNGEGGGNGGGGGGGSDGVAAPKGCSYAGDARGGELPIGLAFVALVLVARLARRRRAA